VLRILDTDRKIMVPVSNANAVGLRQVISEQEIREIFDILKERTIGFDTQTWNRRYRGFMEKIKTGSLFEVAEVFRDLYRLKEQKTLSFGERRMLDTAKNLIVKELAVAKGAPENKIEKELDKIFSC
jgi:CarD family transcriptional regulator